MAVLLAEPPDEGHHLEQLRRDVAHARSHMERLLEILRLERLLAP